MEMPNLTPPEMLKMDTPQGLNKALIIPIVVLIVGLGIASGYFFAGRNRVETTAGGAGVISPSAIIKGAEFGLKDESTFRDTAVGVLQAGGIDTEGTHKLVREGGSSQTVYLISSVLDLDQFSGKKVQVWGETNKAQKAGWLMDVGKVKILE